MIKFENVSLTFGDKTVLKNINLHIPKGGIYGIIGPPASGKSVLVKTICGLLKAKGKLFVDNTEIIKLNEDELVSIRRKIGMLFQNNALFDFMKVWENVAFPLSRLYPEMSEDILKQHAYRRLKDVGLSGSEEKWPAELSGGMQKRVGVARAIITEPPIVIYDEPTAGLDPVTTSKIYDLLDEIRLKSDSTVIAISSDISGLRKFARNLVMLNEGEIVFDGTNEDIEKSQHPVVYQFIRGILDGPL